MTDVFHGESYVVICKDDEGYYTLATRQAFATRRAALAYLDTLAKSREPLFVSGSWDQIRLGEPKRLLVKLGEDWLPSRMTCEEAHQHGEWHMPPDHREARCKVVISEHHTPGGDWFRIEYEPTIWTNSPRELTPAEVVEILGTDRLSGIKLHRKMTRSTLKAAIRCVDTIRA